MIMLIPVAVVCAASLLWWAVQRGHVDIVAALGTHNRGTLVSPVRDFGMLDLRRGDGTPYDFASQPAKWTLLIAGGAPCSEACRDALWLSRQLHTALGRRASQLRRVYVDNAPALEPSLAAHFAAEHPGLDVLHLAAASFDALFDDILSPELGKPAFFLVDQRGLLMMAYTQDNTGRDVIADLKFLMKQSGMD